MIKLILTLLLVIILFLGGCNTIEPYFPVQKEIPKEYMLAELSGKLVDVAGYLRVDGVNALIIWPQGYSLKIEGKEMWVINDKNQAVTRVGDTVKLGGGFLGVSDIEKKIGQALPDDAIGPYFLANPIENKSD